MPTFVPTYSSVLASAGCITHLQMCVRLRPGYMFAKLCTHLQMAPCICRWYRTFTHSFVTKNEPTNNVVLWNNQVFSCCHVWILALLSFRLRNSLVFFSDLIPELSCLLNLCHWHLVSYPESYSFPPVKLFLWAASNAAADCLQISWTISKVLLCLFPVVFSRLWHCRRTGRLEFVSGELGLFIFSDRL